MQHITTVSLSLLVLSILQPLTVSGQDPNPRACFFPGGQRADGYVACDTAATGHSACCRNNNQTACSTTGLCYLERGFYERGACTDQSWQSDSCPGPCRGFRNSGQNLLACSDTTNSFCCGVGGSPSCCENTDSYFTFEIGQIEFINGERVSRTRTVGPPAATTSTGSTNPPTATSAPIEVEKTPTGVLVGMAVGITLPSLIAIVFALLYFREKRKHRNSMKHEGNYGHFGGGHDPSEREGFMRGAWTPGGNGGAVDSPGLGAVPIPPKYVPPERRGDALQAGHQQQPLEGAQLQGTPLGELPGQNIEGLSELAGSERRLQ